MGFRNTITQGTRFREMGECVLSLTQSRSPCLQRLILYMLVPWENPCHTSCTYSLVTFSGLHSTETAVSIFIYGYLEHVRSNALIRIKSNWESPKSIWECLGSSGTHSQPCSLSRSISLGVIHP